ncbi:tripartite tricarboxylate transporter substrate binding protein [Pusillimonas sp. SM2304]|uniref:Bug family tripartite tricarboxylate transporter substrate binding protein n=1 Tax=Pusillimonas sp. SM2304 TaxID=3073241 RepID=UPI00287627C8|nr:tripartite tricarboxylate transporter substrate binding protein [Pusillimonas sp. SM2304]MDS1140581.1 tripartite tricarboxylate transporter substrate binding protein [Pusillimonas sp. SM2304]
MDWKKYLRTSGAALLLAAPLVAGAADKYPAQPVKIIVPFPAGGQGIDLVARTLAQRMQASAGEAVIVDNRPGGGTVIGTSAAAKAPADGYTLLMMANSFTVNPSLQSNLPYDSRKDFTPVSLLTITPHVLVARQDLPANKLSELLELAKKNPGTVTYASIGNGTSPHLAGEMLKKLTGADLVHVPHKGTPLALTSLMGGHVDVLFGNLPDVLPYVNDGKLKALAISAPKRHASLPDVPTMEEQGLAEFESNSWYGMLAPANVPDSTIQQLNELVVSILQEKEVRESFDARGLEVIASTPAEFGDWLRKEMDKYAQIIKESGARID